MRSGELVPFEWHCWACGLDERPYAARGVWIPGDFGQEIEHLHCYQRRFRLNPEQEAGGVRGGAA